MGDVTTRMIDPHGVVRDIPAEQVSEATGAGFTPESDDQARVRIAKEIDHDRNTSVGGKINAVAYGGLRGLTLGASDVAMRAFGGDAAAEYLNGIREANPGFSMASELVGSLALPGGIIGKGGGAATEGALGAVARSIRGAATEGALYGAGSGVSELALSDKPLDVERVASVLSSHMLYGGVTGGAVGGAGKLAELGLSKARATLAAREGRAVVDDLAQLDVKQLSAARKTEIDAIRAEHRLETEALESTRKVDRETIADDIASLRREVKESNQWATTKDVKLAVVEGKLSAAELGRMGAKAERQLAGMLDNPIGLAKNPAKALDALQRQEHGLVTLLDHADDLRATYVVDGLGGKRAAALEAAPKLLEKNRSLQERIAKSMEAHPPVPTSSARLEAIDAAKDALAGSASSLASVPQRMLEGTAFGAVAGVVGNLAIPGAGLVAGIVGASVSKMLGEKVFGRLSSAASGQAARASKVAQQFLGHAERGVKASVPIASRVLASTRFSEGRNEDRKQSKQSKPGGTHDVGRLFEKRAAEVRSLVEPGPDGTIQMREGARAKVASHLSPIGLQFPLLADALEEIAARRAVFLADKLPKKPDMFAHQIGPETWRPSDMEVRKWARYVAGVEDPQSIMDRVVDGSVSPEDAEVMRVVYPEMLADLQQQIIEQSSSAKTTIPYQRRLALSRLTGIAVDPTMDPRILAVIQAAHASEEGTDGGTQSPRAAPQFGSVSKALGEPTAAQRRAS